MLMTDLDGVCGGADPSKSYDPRVLQRAFDRAAEWDVVSFIFEPYWDLWAFRQAEIHPYDHFGWNHKKNEVSDASALTRWIKRQPAAQMIEVESAFMMMAIYKLGSIGGCRYSDRERSGRKTCEHVPFHECIRREQEGRVRIWPEAYCEGDRGWPNGSEPG